MRDRESRTLYDRFTFCRGGRATTSVTVCVTEQRLATAEAELHKRDQIAYNSHRIIMIARQRIRGRQILCK